MELHTSLNIRAEVRDRILSKMTFPKELILLSFGVLIWSIASSTARTIHTVQNNNVTLDCYSNCSEWWITPNQNVITSSQSLRNNSVFMENGSLVIDKVTPEDDGTYTCAFYDEGKKLVLKTMQLQVEPEIETGNAWQKYKSQFVTGLVASGVVAGLIFFGCMVFRYRWRDPERKRLSNRDSLTPTPDFDGAIADARF